MGHYVMMQARDTKANWETNNPILPWATFGMEDVPTEQHPSIKRGDGATAWNDLPYLDNIASTEMAGMVYLATDADVANGIEGKVVDAAQLHDVIGQSGGTGDYFTVTQQVDLNQGFGTTSNSHITVAPLNAPAGVAECFVKATASDNGSVTTQYLTNALTGDVYYRRGFPEGITVTEGTQTFPIAVEIAGSPHTDYVTVYGHANQDMEAKLQFHTEFSGYTTATGPILYQGVINFVNEAITSTGTFICTVNEAYNVVTIINGNVTVAPATVPFANCTVRVMDAEVDFARHIIIVKYSVDWTDYTSSTPPTDWIKIGGEVTIEPTVDVYHEVDNNTNIDDLFATGKWIVTNENANSPNLPVATEQFFLDIKGTVDGLAAWQTASVTSNQTVYNRSLVSNRIISVENGDHFDGTSAGSYTTYINPTTPYTTNFSITLSAYEDGDGGHTLVSQFPNPLQGSASIYEEAGTYQVIKVELISYSGTTPMPGTTNAMTFTGYDETGASATCGVGYTNDTESFTGASKVYFSLADDTTQPRISMEVLNHEFIWESATGSSMITIYFKLSWETTQAGSDLEWSTWKQLSNV